jgi:uncharacterized protein DUF1800
VRQQSRIVVEEAVQGRIIRALEGPRQLQKVMTAFWFNHFNVFAGKGLCHLWLGCFEQAAVRLSRTNRRSIALTSGLSEMAIEKIFSQLPNGSGNASTLVRL